MTTYPAHIETKANEMLAKGAKMTFGAICEMYMKQESKFAKKSTSRSEAAKWNQREVAANTVASSNPNEWLAAKNLENAKNNLPSSLR